MRLKRLTDVALVAFGVSLNGNYRLSFSVVLRKPIS